MLIGEYHHTLDEKKRVSLPSKFRKELGRSVVITYGLDKCLFVYSLKEWKGVADKLSQLSMGQANTRGFHRFMLAGAVEADVDSSGRVLLPDYLKDYASLSEKAVVSGVYTRAEIWNEETWVNYKRGIELKADEMAEKLGELGVI